MKSPFPGMDPYLEGRWPGVHVLLISAITEMLQGQLPPALRARPEERLLLESVEDVAEIRQYKPDVMVVETGGHGAPAEASSVATIEPVAVHIELPELFDRFIQIVDVSAGDKVVTVIEILSPWNKAAGTLNQKYMEKLAGYQAARINIVEVDLLRSSRRHLPVSHEIIPAERRATYMACVWFSQNPMRWFAYPIPLRGPLPTIPVPLRATDPVLGLELQPALDRVYRAGGHDDIDYRRPLEPALGVEDEAWADGVLREAGRR
jgi:hypothetical protein